MPKNDNTETVSDAQKMECVQKLKTLLKETEKLKNLQTRDSYLERFLYSTDFDVDASFNKIKMYYELVHGHPDWFPTLGPLDKKTIIDKDVRAMIPQYDKEGRIIYVAKLGNLDTDTMEIFDIIAIDDIWIESVLEDNPRIAQKGLCVIADASGYSWKMLKWITPEYMRLSIKKLIALPFKDYRFHIVNTSMAIHIAIKIVWPFLPASVKEMMKLHFNDWNSLYEHIDKEVLPIEYGGPSCVNYNELYEKLYNKNDEILKCSQFRKNVCS